MAARCGSARSVAQAPEARRAVKGKEKRRGVCGEEKGKTVTPEGREAGEIEKRKAAYQPAFRCEKLSAAKRRTCENGRERVWRKEQSTRREV